MSVTAAADILDLSRVSESKDANDCNTNDELRCNISNSTSKAELPQDLVQESLAAGLEHDPTGLALFPVATNLNSDAGNYASTPPTIKSPTFGLFTSTGTWDNFITVSAKELYQSPSANPSGKTRSQKSKQSMYKKPAGMDEGFKSFVDQTLQNLIHNSEIPEVSFPTELSSEERRYIHVCCKDLGLGSKSKGSGSSRCLTAFKKQDTACFSATGPRLPLQPGTCNVIQDIVRLNPLTPDERRLVCGFVIEGAKPTERETLGPNNITTGRLSSGIPQVPPRASCDIKMMQQRMQLPIWNSREDITGSIMENQVSMVVGDTGCGKTTQVPQYILEQHCSLGKRVRIVVTQPRRLATISVADRIATERAEAIGQIVGYQIRLESKVSPRTILTVCTNGVLLRTLMSGSSFLDTVTHIVLDEIHERDQHSDFLLAILKDVLPRYPHLKLVLMSATVETEKFVAYFNHECPIVEVPTPHLEVCEYFLEQIIQRLQYSTSRMKQYIKNRQEDTFGDFESVNSSSWTESNPEYDSVLERCVIEKDECIMLEFIQSSLDYSEVNYRHSETHMTPLMVAAMMGWTESVKALLQLVPNIHAKANGSTALDFAKMFNHEDTITVLENHMKSRCIPVWSSQNDFDSEDEESRTERLALEAYQASVDEDRVDLDLIFALILRIHRSFEDGAILVFLPGYEEIMTLNDMIYDSDEEFGTGSYRIFTLHSSMRSGEQRSVFQSLEPRVRKIVLATNIAETSITIPDIVFVIDCGKVKEKSFDTLTMTSMLKAVWISKASVTQRKGRAGRCRKGVCFHLFSRQRYELMQDYQTPEILRMQIHELCLQAKALAPKNAVADLLSKVPSPPSSMVVKNAISLLKQMEALGPNEELTPLGVHLLDLPMDPKWGKSIIYAVVLRCLDPVLTICCTFAHKDPFELPSNNADKQRAIGVKQAFSAGTYSDHMAILRAFQLWQESQFNRGGGGEREFCRRNFISSSNMHSIVACRTQILAQLRASGFVKTKGGQDMKELNVNSGSWAVVKAALTAGAYPSLLRKEPEREQWVSKRHAKVRFNSRSVLSDRKSSRGELPTSWAIFEELSRCGSSFATALNATLITPVTVALFAGPTRDLGPTTATDLDDGSDIFGAMSTFVEAPTYGDTLAPKTFGHYSSATDDPIHTGSFNTTNCDNVVNLLDGLTISDVIENGALSKHQVSGSDSVNPFGVDPSDPFLKVDSWIKFYVEPTSCAHALRMLRLKWNAFFLKRMIYPNKPCSQLDESLLKAVVTVLQLEESAHNLTQPTGIGNRPRPVGDDHLTISRQTPRQWRDPSGSGFSPNSGSGRSNWQNNNNSSSHHGYGSQNHQRYEQPGNQYTSFNNPGSSVIYYSNKSGGLSTASGLSYSHNHHYHNNSGFGNSKNNNSFERSSNGASGGYYDNSPKAHGASGESSFGGANGGYYNHSPKSHGASGESSFGGRQIVGRGNRHQHSHYSTSPSQKDANLRSLNLVVFIESKSSFEVALRTGTLPVSHDNHIAISEALADHKCVFLYILVGQGVLNALARVLRSSNPNNSQLYCVDWVHSFSPHRPLPFPIVDGQHLSESQARRLSSLWN